MTSGKKIGGPKTKTKGAFLIEAKQLFFCEVNFVYMFTNGTIFLHANDW